MSEASLCRSAIRAARGVVADLGESSSSKSKGLVDLSRCCEHHSERDVEVVQRRFKLQLPVRISELKKVPGVRYQGNFHVISLRDWTSFLVRYNVWHVMVGLYQPNPDRERAILSEFWRCYRLWKPEHMIWQWVEEYNVDLSKCLPVLLHADEGRGRKKAPFLIAQYHSFLGFGTNLANERRTHRPYRSMKLNYSESSHIHRLITGCLPKMTKDEMALSSLLKFMAADAVSMIKDGIVSPQGDRYWVACLNSVGDWAWLAKCASLTRSFHNIHKRPMTERSNPKGICHWCLAGQRDYPYEDLSSQVAWTRTQWMPNDQPWVTRPVLLDLPHEPSKPSAFFAFDLWHSLHLGVAKSFVAGVFALVSDRMISSSIDARFEELTDRYLQWCDESRTTPYVCSITKESCGWLNRSCFPNGMWSKGHVSTTFLRFLEYFFQVTDVSDSFMLKLCAEGTRSINRALDELYGNDLFLSVGVSTSVGRSGMKFLAIYQHLALHSFRNGLALFPKMPKIHVCHHCFLDLSSTTTPCVSPLCYSVQCDEDYVGKKCRLSRRVGTQQSILRTLQRSLAAAYSHWQSAGFFLG